MFCLSYVLSDNVEGEGFITYTAARQQAAIKMFRVHFYVALCCPSVHTVNSLDQQSAVKFQVKTNKSNIKSYTFCFMYYISHDVLFTKMNTILYFLTE